MKQCKGPCGQTKSLNEFYKSAGLKDGHAGKCKVCRDLDTAAWREKNKDAYNEYMRERNKHHYEDYRLKRYGTTRDWYEDTLQKQDNKCAICSKSNPSKKRKLATDHHHGTGKVRGLLCYGCNRLMVLLDDLELLDKAIAYKKFHE